MTIVDLIERSDYELFTNVCSGSHSLDHLLAPYRTSDLRLRGHPFQLPDYYTDFHKKSFIFRSLYEYIKYNSRLLVLVVLLLCVLLLLYFLCFTAIALMCLCCAFCRILIKIT